MSVLWWMLLIVLAAGGVIGWHCYHYPGSWRHTFGAEHDGARRDLDTARGALRRLESSRRKEVSGAQAGVDAAAATRRRRIREIEQRIADLREPGRGTLREELGPLSLYQHVLEVRTDDERSDLPLHGISVRSDHSADAGHVYVVDPGGRQHLLTYPAAETAEDRLRRFVVDVHNAIADAKALQVRNASRIRDAEADLENARSDTSKQTRAQERLDETTARWQDDPRIPKARKELEAAHDRWQALTGRRPR
ncbi:hypothetical protein [Kitasatospora sp. NPDC093558]|uniref:hypothetical protein n=1 Tax=Kitasatospora sp. NPDC093558 TaxID=3155201 RepID=UPI003439167A